mgnify:CR=1 FL=1
MIYLYIIASIAIIYGAHKLDERAERRRNRRVVEQFNRRTGIHPADDLYLSDSWPELERWKEGRK